MNIMETMKSITDLAKKGMTVELQEKVVELKEEVINLKDENVQLRSDNLELKSQIDELSNGEPCPKCRKAGWEFIESKPHPIFGGLGCLERTFKCSACGFSEKHMYDPNKA
jgi:regulator of replication initiation timing